MDGMTCLREMRARHINTPVIILTARGEEYDKLAGLESGADDYVVKPFSPRELVARVKAVLNRTMPKPAAASDTMTFGELTIDTASHTVRVSGEEVALTPKEFDLLVFLASNKGIALSREKILQKVWNYDYFGEDRTVDTHVKMLRGHLGKCRRYSMGHRLQIRPRRNALIKERRIHAAPSLPRHPRPADVVFVLYLSVPAGTGVVSVHPAAGTAVHQAH
jgi:two-component system response regulator ResD